MNSTQQSCGQVNDTHETHRTVKFNIQHEQHTPRSQESQINTFLTILPVQLAGRSVAQLYNLRYIQTIPEPHGQDNGTKYKLKNISSNLSSQAGHCHKNKFYPNFTHKPSKITQPRK